MDEENLDKQLNKRERYKARLRPFDYFAEFETLDFESLGEGDRFYLQDFGIFNADFLEDEFTLRLRIAAGRLTPKQFSYVADIVKKHDLTLILTARGAIQLHDLEAQNILEIWKSLNSMELTSWQSFGDNIRNIVTDVYDGVSQYGEIEVYPIIMQMQEFILKNPRYVGMLPRRVSIGISGNRANVTSFFANDIYFALAQKGTTLGFNVYMGGKNSEVAKDADIFLLQDEVFDFFKAFVEAFYLHGSRFSRSKTRLFYLIESMGLDTLKSYIQKEYKKELVSAGEILLQKATFTKNDTLKDGSFSFRYQTDFGRLSTKEIEQIAQYSQENNTEIRIGIDQNIYLIGLAEKNTPFDSLKKSATVVACAGSLCPYSFWNIKDETSYLPLDKIEKHQIQVGFSGCAKGCGRHQHSDIGLIGLKTNHFGDTEGGARIFVGAQHLKDVKISRMLFSMVPFPHLHNVISLIINTYELSGYKSFEDFSYHVLNKFSEGFLGMWILANIKTSQTLKLEESTNTDISFIYEKELLANYFPKADFLTLIDDSFFNVISILSKELWTIEGKDPIYKPPIKRVNFR
jgi:ferredoxin-nitrite reductase